MKIHILLLLFLLVITSCQKESVNGNILIQNGLLYSGLPVPPDDLDVIISADSIIWIGNSKEINPLVDTIINAQGKIITPGFIDIHAHGDPLNTPEFENFLAMGVTSIALGMDGSSISVSNLPRWTQSVDSIVPGVNVLPFIGHGTIRSESSDGGTSTISDNQLNSMTESLIKAFEYGVWGLSMGLEYLPGYYADSVELKALAKVVGQYQGLITSHIRNEDNDKVESSLVEMLNLLKYCNVNISHLKVVYGKGNERASEILNLFENTESNHRLSADLYPYTASYTGIGIVFPTWAKVPKKYEKIRKDRGEELAKHLRTRVSLRNGPDATLFGSGPYKGRTLQSVAEEYSMPFELVLRDIIGPYGASAAYFVMDDELQESLFKSKFVAVASDGSPTMYHPRGHGTFSKVIHEYVMMDSLVDLEEAIYKMSAYPAEILGLHNRGKIEVGQKADLLLFDPSQIKSNASFESPHELSTGMEIVIINGTIGYASRKITNRSGRVLLKVK